MKFKFNNGI